MNHLGELLTAFLDGELTGAECDRVTAHLVRCERCRTEAAALRELKNRLRELGGLAADADAELARRLIAVPEMAAGQAAPPPRIRRITARPHRTTAQRRPGGSRGPRGGKQKLTRRGYVVLGAMSVVVGLGAAAFSVGGSGDSGTGPGPRITPQVELFSQEHAITTGEVPFTELASPRR